MAEIVRMPKLSDTMTEGVVASWLKQVGDEVENGEILAEIETDKATMEFESFFDGVLLHIGVEQGGMAPVDSLLCILGEKGEDISKILKAAATAAAAEEKVAAPARPASRTRCVTCSSTCSSVTLLPPCPAPMVSRFERATQSVSTCKETRRRARIEPCSYPWLGGGRPGGQTRCRGVSSARWSCFDTRNRAFH